ncbi:RtcB family protein [Litorilinea aerophila]|uniref:tRNA-splicing ligase RtcB n=1 Tax=Litorilinea aerophila TaxID=1204385 RepID=A0A540VDJ0_9CHLR|nr:RtcB family protein [Litorilinea aerophila]
MVQMKDLIRIDKYVWEIPKSYRHDMRVPARIYASRTLLEKALTDKSIEQLVNATTLPGIVGYAIAMPDVHQGYGFPVGGVAATRLPDGVISPGSIGYDINCGVRLLASDIYADEIEPHLDTLATALYQNCPSGVGQGGRFRLSDKELDQVLAEGAHWCLSRGLATNDDVRHAEETGRLRGADPARVSKHARDRGRDQLGTLGAGNHFLEVDQVTAIYDEEAAEAYGLRLGQVVVLIHCGSRGLGHQVCTDYVRDFQKALQRYHIQLPDRELVCAPLNSPEGEAYTAAMQAAANFAFANRQVLAHLVRETFEQVFAGTGLPFDVRQVYDVAHNIGKIEWHTVDGQRMQVCVHRKGATRAFAPGSDEIPPDYRAVGQPVLVPGSMGTASYVLAGTQGAMEQTFGSTCHGAGRNLSRTAAKKQVRGEELKQRLSHQGIRVRAGSMRGLAEEAPVAYKQVEEVIEVVEGAGIARAVARLEPMAVIKG